MAKRGGIGAGRLVRRAWRSPWPPSMCWSSGMVYRPPRRASCPSRWLNLVCKILIGLVDLIVMVMHFLQAGRQRDTLPGMEEHMTTIDFITALFCQVDDPLAGIPKHPHATLWPSEIVTLGILHARKGVGNRAFYRWLTRDYRALFPRLPERTRLFRLFRTHQDWTQVFLAAPTVLGVIDTYGVELIHPMREGRSPQQIGRKGLYNHRWIVGGKLCLLLNQYGVGGGVGV